MAVTGRVPLLVALRALGLGDLLTAVPALRALTRAFPGHRRVLALPAPLAPLLEIAETGFCSAPHTELEPLAPQLHGADVAVNLHGRGPQSHRLLMATRPRRLIAFASEGAGGPRWRAGEHEVSRWCRMLEESGVPADRADLDIRPPREPAPRRVHGATLIHPGAAQAARRWPAQRWAAVARAEMRAGRRVVVSGGPGEERLARDVAAAAHLPAASVVAGRTGLRRLAALVAGAALVACGDTGVAHLATALGTRSVVLFGPTPPAEWGPPRGRGLHRALWAGGRGDPHAGSADEGLLAIGTNEVEAELAALAR